jgi:hypothetical protein
MDDQRSTWLFRSNQHADTPHPLGLLRARRERPRDRRAAEQRDELAASYVEHEATSPPWTGGTQQ